MTNYDKVDAIRVQLLEMAKKAKPNFDVTSRVGTNDEEEFRGGTIEGVYENLCTYLEDFAEALNMWESVL